MTSDIVERLRAACTGHPYAKIEWPHRILHEAADEIERLRATPAQPAGMREALATALARRLCQLFDSGGESQRSVRARHASAIFQLLSAGTSDSREWQKCDADPVTYLEDCERRAALPAERPAVAQQPPLPGLVATLRSHADDCEDDAKWATPELAPLLRRAADVIEAGVSPVSSTVREGGAK